MTTVTVVGSELAFGALGYAEHDNTLRLLLVTRSAFLSFSLAAWAGWYVLRTRRRIEALREELLWRKFALETEAMRAEQAVGLGAHCRILAHEVRAPLNAIVIHSELLRRHARVIVGSESLQGIVDVLHTESARLKRLVHDYVAYGRAGDVLVRPTAVRLQDVVTSVAAEEEHAMLAAGIALTIDAPADVASAHADGTAIAYLLQLLLRRSRETVHDGGFVRIGLASEPPRVSLTICDDGAGFADPDAVFRPFSTQDPAGTGFGLAIARDIVRAHGGEIRAANARGEKGASLTIWLPEARLE